MHNLKIVVFLMLVGIIIGLPTIKEHKAPRYASTFSSHPEKPHYDLQWVDMTVGYGTADKIRAEYGVYKAIVPKKTFNMPIVRQAVVGEEFTLYCYVHGNVTSTRWYKNGRLLISDSRVHILNNGTELKISAVLASDSGTFRCLASDNDNNRLNINYNLTVTKSSIFTLCEQRVNWTAPKDPRTPHWTERFQAFRECSSSKIEVFVGDELQLSCQAYGSPSPVYAWNYYSDPMSNDRYKKFDLKSPGVLSLARVKRQDAGKYTCVAYNWYGEVRHTYDVFVKEPPSHWKPKIFSNSLQNSTAVPGQNVTLKCEGLWPFSRHDSQILDDIHVTRYSSLEFIDTTIRWRWESLDGAESRDLALAPRHRCKSKGCRFTSSNLKFLVTERPAEIKGLHLCYIYPSEHARLYRKESGRPTLLPRYIYSNEKVPIVCEGKYTCIVSNIHGSDKRSAYVNFAQSSPEEIKDTPVLESTTNTHSPNGLIIITVGVCCVILLLATIVSCFFYHKYQNQRKILQPFALKNLAVHFNNEAYRLRPPPNICAEGPHRCATVRADDIHSNDNFSNSDSWEISPQKINCISVLGEGHFGLVYKAEAHGIRKKYPGSILVAVKISKDNGTSSEERQTLLKEIEMMKQTGFHTNIINMIGYSTKKGPVMMIVEYARHGNLRDFLRSNKSNSRYQGAPSGGDIIEADDGSFTLSRNSLIMFAYQIARGVEYLHSRRVLHRDLAARNVLVFEGFIMKLSDFGLSRNIGHDDYYRKNTSGALPVRYMAPESIAENKWTTEADAWSYGILVWEIFSFGDAPNYSCLDPCGLIHVLRQGERLRPPENCPAEIVTILKRCWQLNEEARPTLLSIMQQLDELLLAYISTAVGLMDGALSNSRQSMYLNPIDRRRSCSRDSQYHSTSLRFSEEEESPSDRSYPLSLPARSPSYRNTTMFSPPTNPVVPYHPSPIPEQNSSDVTVSLLSETVV